jgi:2-polyprenyl-6-methoxyphenol hydroxylase-like FAD-dependent oxidoreductase
VSEGLLDSYHAERHPAAERVTMQTQAQLALMAPGPAVTALRQVVAELLETPAGTGQIAGLLAHTATPPADALLVRPDGYVAWALGPTGTDDLLDALATWFGDPDPPRQQTPHA